MVAIDGCGLFLWISVLEKYTKYIAYYSSVDGMEAGFGTLNLVGKDVILGLGQDSFLSQDLVNRLNQRDIHLLYQASWEDDEGRGRFKLD
jgi:hypothetical protein